MNVPEYALPEGLDAELLESADGFSQVSPVIIPVSRTVDTDRFSGYEQSLTSGSPIIIVNEDLSHRVPFSAWQRESDKYLVLFPLEAFRPGERYYVIVKGFLPYRDGGTYRSGLSEEEIFSRPGYGEIVERLGLPASDVQAIWDFPVRTRDNAAYFRSITLTVMEELDDVRIVSVEEYPSYESGVARNVRLVMEFPEFLDENRRLKKPLRPTGITRNVFLLKVPEKDGSKGEIPFVLFGHGLSAVKETMEIVAPELCSAGFYMGGIDASFHGERQKYTGSLINLFLKLDVTFAGVFRDAQVETVIQEFLLIYFIKTHAEEIFGRDEPVKVFYIGQSMGSYLGTVLLSATREVEAAVLNVGGCCIGRVMSSDFINGFVGIERQLLRTLSIEDIAVLLGLSQTIMDAIEPVSYASWLKKNVKAVVLQESVDDGIVLNETTNTLARAAGLVLFNPYVRKVPGLEVSPVGSEQTSSWGMYQFTVEPNIFYELLTPHVMLLAREPAIQARDLFLTFLDADPANDGRLEDLCNGPCVVK